MFNIGDKVVCVDPGTTSYLRLGNLYTISRVDMSLGTYFVMTEGYDLYFLGRRFVSIVDWAEVKEEDLLSLI